MIRNSLAALCRPCLAPYTDPHLSHRRPRIHQRLHRKLSNFRKWSSHRYKVVSGICIVTNIGWRYNRRDLTTQNSDELAPSWSGDGESIAYQSADDGDWDIYTMTRDGGDVRQITDDDGADEQPAFSPLDDRLAFTSDRDGDYDIYLRDGRDIVQLTNASGRDRYPAWSPDGTQIAFSSERDGNAEIYVMNADGSEPSRITNSTSTKRHPSWSPDGRSIVFESLMGDDWEIMLINLADGTETRLTDNAVNDNNPIFADDANFVLFDRTEGTQQNLIALYVPTGGETVLNTGFLVSADLDFHTRFDADVLYALIGVVQGQARQVILVFDAPSWFGAVEGRIENGMLVSIMSVHDSNRWYSVGTQGGVVGWVRAGDLIYIDTVGDVADLPVVSE
jgi:dipeptidyl aminopeptidase/acylaminoacyl peptidase